MRKARAFVGSGGPTVNSIRLQPFSRQQMAVCYSDLREVQST